MLRNIFKIAGMTLLLITIYGFFDLTPHKTFYRFLDVKKTVFFLKIDDVFLEKTKDVKEIYLLGNKETKILKLYGKKENEEKFTFIKEYPFTDFSGIKGPKLKELDGQIPEGIYKPIFLNSRSNYHLSVHINYPNEFDKKKGIEDKRDKLGNEIFIHGKNVSIGCIAIGDSAIEEVFYIIEKIGMEKTKVVITPNDLRVYPEIESITWENELYDLIKQDMDKNLN